MKLWGKKKKSCDWEGGGLITIWALGGEIDLRTCEKGGREDISRDDGLGQMREGVLESVGREWRAEDGWNAMHKSCCEAVKRVAVGKLFTK